ncbi:VanZ family protein [Nitrosomonas eutropha]|uniref:VanZ family protein n=1 Tax=Nitrosomonas eutropha TaxID=916 RepID=UPI0008B5B867|nr:VanZ family protein [Nitrosomonas eutropha]SEI62440.1 VanZ like family protein [Nitrosomonas eutropha]
MMISHSSRHLSFSTKVLTVLVLLITYGSLYPGNFTHAAPGALEQFFINPEWTTSIGDILGNIVLFLPLGIAGERVIHSQNKIPDLLLLTIISFIFSLILQILQIWLPTRSAALVDVFWNITGLFTGIGVSVLIKQISLLWPGRQSFPGGKAAIPLAILLLWLCSELLPLVPSLDWQKFKDAVKPLQTLDFSFSSIWIHAASIITAGSILSLLAPKPLVWLTGALLFILAGKITIVNQLLDTSTISGLLAGYLASVLLLKTSPHTRIVVAFWSLLTAWTIHALTPFSFTIGGTFNFIPFATMLEGSMLTNAMALVLSLYIYSALLWFAPYTGGNFRGIVLALVFWSIVIELIQMALLGRNADITEPLLIGLIAWGLGESRQLECRIEIPHPIANPVPDKPIPFTPHSHRTDSPTNLSLFSAWIPVILLSMGATSLLWLILHLPQIPYNLKELFLFDGNILFIFIFILTLLWIGAGAAWISSRILSSTRPFISLPGWVLTVSLISLGLLSISVTQESIADITGSNNIYWFVINKDIWGEGWRHIFEWLGPTLISTLERPVRYTALYAPLVIFLALIISFFSLRKQRAQVTRKMLILVISALPWLWLAKTITFSWSSTDNLNELIARTGAIGMGGGFYLYVLLFVLCVNAIILVNLSGNVMEWILGIVLSLIMLPIGWWLLSLGLESEVHKYGYIFSGPQFLLGPDRKQILPEAELFTRWCLVQTGFIIIISSGIRSFSRITRQYM